MQERIREEVLLAMHTALDGEEAFTDGSVDDITQAIMAVFEESLPELDKEKSFEYFQGQEAYRNEAIKVIRGNDNE